MVSPGARRGVEQLPAVLGTHFFDRQLLHCCQISRLETSFFSAARVIITQVVVHSS